MASSQVREIDYMHLLPTGAFPPPPISTHCVSSSSQQPSLDVRPFSFPLHSVASATLMYMRIYYRIDDPLTWGILPTRTYLHSHLMRWTLGASDIMFTNPVFSAFFRKGQVIETFRGKGVYQPALDLAIEKLRFGAWVHLFGEGKVCQSGKYKADPQTGIARLERFKWGIGRILMETPRLPTIIPMWITGTSHSRIPRSRPSLPHICIRKR